MHFSWNLGSFNEAVRDRAAAGIRPSRRKLLIPPSPFPHNHIDMAFLFTLVKGWAGFVSGIPSVWLLLNMRSFHSISPNRGARCVRLIQVFAIFQNYARTICQCIAKHMMVLWPRKKSCLNYHSVWMCTLRVSENGWGLSGDFFFFFLLSKTQMNMCFKYWRGFWNSLSVGHKSQLGIEFINSTRHFVYQPNLPSHLASAVSERAVTSNVFRVVKGLILT